MKSLKARWMEAPSDYLYHVCNHSEPLWGSLPGSHYTQLAWYLGVNLAAFTNVSNNDAQQEGSWEGEGFIVVRLLLSLCVASVMHTEHCLITPQFRKSKVLVHI